MLKTATKFNNFGLLRLVFASMVVLSHAFELIDGNRSRELLTRVFGSLSFGEVGVDGFFLLSGYLITQSYLNSPRLLSYLTKRVARIYPAFLAATVVSVGVFAPLSGTALSMLATKDWIHVVKFALLLQPPPVQAFVSVPIPSLNGAMWTIAYEFRCYLLVACLGSVGMMRRRELILVAAIVAILFMAARPPITFAPNNEYFGNISQAIRMTGAFLAGSTFYLYRDSIPYRTGYAVGAAIVLVACMFVKGVAEPALCIFGGYFVCWLALAVQPSPVANLTTRNDISYGLYLYTWPIQTTLVFLDRTISPWTMFVTSLLAAALCGYLSWKFLESHIQRLVHGDRVRTADIGVSGGVWAVP